MVVLVLLVSILGAGGYYAWNSPSSTPTPFPPPTPTLPVTPMPTPSFDVDASWIPDVLRLLEDAKPYQHEFKPGLPTPRDHHPAMKKIYFYEAGSHHLVIYGPDGDEFYQFLEGLLLQANVDTQVPTNHEYIDLFKKTNTIVELEYRFYTTFHIWENVDRTLFVLEDHLDQELVGTIFVRQILGGVSTWSRYVITSFSPATPTPGTYLLHQNGSETSVFLVNSQLYYGVYVQNFTRRGGGVFSVEEGDPCIIINGTIRNEYDQDYYLLIGAEVLNASGVKIGPIISESAPLPGFCVVFVEQGSTDVFDLRIPYNATDITEYTLLVKYEPTEIPPP